MEKSRLGKKKRMIFTLDEDVVEKLDVICSKNKIPRSTFVNILLAQLDENFNVVGYIDNNGLKK